MYQGRSFKFGLGATSRPPVSGIKRRSVEEDSQIRFKDAAADEIPVVLVVDDEARNRDLARAYLESTYKVLEANSGEAALAIVDETRVDLVLLDVMLPGTTGFETCRRMKERSRGAFLPVILLTALDDQEHRNEGLAAEADDYLTKPVNRRELMLRVKAFLRIREQERAIRAQFEALRELEDLKDDLVSLIVHDLRNPLAGMLPLLSSLAATVTDPDQAEDLAMASDAARKMQVTLEDLLRVRQLEEGRLPLRREFVDVEELARGVQRTIEGAARQRGVTLEVAIEPGTVAALDVELVRRSLENLMMNSVKFTARDTTVTVSAGRVGSLVEITVSDRGPGIPEAAKEQVFAKFGKLEGQTAGARRGFGLGLYLVRLVANAHGGGATVSDRDGGGSVFRMLLA